MALVKRWDASRASSRPSGDHDVGLSRGVLWLLDAKTSNGIVLAQVDVLDGRYFLGKYIVIPSCALGRIPAVKMPMVVG